MASGWCLVRGPALWATVTLGLVVTAYGCGGSSNSDYNGTPPGSGGTAGSAGRAGASSGAKGGASAAGSSGGDVTAGSGGTGGGSELGGGGGKGGSGGTRGGKAGASAGGSNAKGGSSGGVSMAGGPPAGGAGEVGGASGEGGTPACNPDDTSVPFKTRCLACATDTCGTCLCNDCTQKLETCQNTPGCQDVADCVIASGCNSEACYCGTYGLVECLAGQSDGPCKDVMLNAPGGHAPTATDVSAGPATDAALAVGLCAISGGPCANECM